MRVLLMSTPYPLEENPIPPLSLSYLAGVLQREGIEIQILDLLVAHYSAKKVREKLEEYQPQVVGVTCVTLNYPTAARILRVCKDFDPGILTIIGGPHASFALKETLLGAPWIDILVLGEGERTLVELIRALEKGTGFHQVSGIAFREDKRVVQTGRRSPIEDLDELPFPVRHLLPLSKYRALGAPCTVTSSRGCPFGCIFCSGRRIFGRRVRFRHPKLVVDEIETIHKELGFESINIVDDTFTLNHRHARNVCEEIMRRNLHIQWNVFARVDTVTEDLLKIMKEAGCVWLLFGVESASPQILETIKKGITLDGVRRGVKLATEAGIKVFNSFILGLPGETPETARQSVAFAQELDSDYGAKYGFHLLSPLPGTELYEKAEDYGLRILTRDWAKYDANEPITETATMSPEKVMEIMADYDRAVAYAWDEIKCKAEAGDRLCEEKVREKASKEFVWRLLKGDVIEKLGHIKALDAGDPVEQLAQKISRRLSVPLDVAQREMERLVQKGLLKRESMKGGFVWKWS
ncbi:MAG: radical SAM protein [Dehalococcoidia bacterium]|nr:MAG: radical SAM protein [Dehalococcoidia bacterium]